MNEELLKHQVEVLETRTNTISVKVDVLEQNQARNEIQIQNLVSSINSLTGALKWLIGLGASALTGFFFYAIQNNLF